MSVAKKIGPVFDDQINAKIQRKFDLVFVEKTSPHTSFSNEKSDNNFDEPQNFDLEEMVMERNGGSNKNSNTKPKIDLDFAADEEAPVIPENTSQASKILKEDDRLGFSLNFEMDLVKNNSSTKTGLAVAPSFADEDYGGFTLDDSDIGNFDFDNKKDATQKTVVFNPSMLGQSKIQDFPSEKTGSSSISIDMMSTEEAKANIESTIKDILRPDFEGTTEFDQTKGHGGLSDVEDSVLDLGHTPPKGIALSEIDEGTFNLDISNSKNAMPTVAINETKDVSINLDVSKGMSSDVTMDFDFNAIKASGMAETKSVQSAEEMEFDGPSTITELDFTETPMATPPAFVGAKEIATVPVETRQYQSSQVEVPSVPTAGLNTEDSMRFQATIRALREEREEMLLLIKSLKGDSKELEQDNLTLKANLDEAKIEITILRKRHMVEIEDLKYRVSVSEEKKAMADEKAKQADMRREKLEQKVRIDFNQVKQREKELESKLELLSMDVDSQVQSRDQKILELRRKIDALEFNMENASIKEQKSLDDKRKLEDRLNKIMKTLRRSIKNLEDDIDQVEDDGDHQKDKN